MTHARLLARLRSISGRRVIARPAAIRRFSTGYRYGGGPALAVVQPLGLIEFWHILQACVEEGAAIIIQAANTGLTGGSTPYGDTIDRPIVIVSPMAIDRIHLLGGGAQVVCLPGARLNRLEAILAPFGREPHSVIGSSCIGASVVGGVCNNSGGALIRRGPAFTELALFAQLGADGRLRLVNRLGIDLGDDAEAMLERLESGAFDPARIDPNPGRASDDDYARRVRRLDAAEPPRFNANPCTLHDASGCAGKIAVFAVRLDTFPRDRRTETFYIGTNDPAELTRFRRQVLSEAAHLPVSAEYIHRDAFNLADTYGRDTVAAIRVLGTRNIPTLYRLKTAIDALGEKLGQRAFGDRVLQLASRLLPGQLSPRLREWQARYEHHLLLTVADEGISEAEDLLRGLWPSLAGDVFKCSAAEATRAYLHRFAVAGAAVRYRAVRTGELGDVLSLDVAHLPGDDRWFESLPPALASDIAREIVYGHFVCHVFHRDYVVRQGVDVADLKRHLLNHFDRRGAKYPAEHNVGHLYAADEPLRAFYAQLDPQDRFNPGIGSPNRGS